MRVVAFDLSLSATGVAHPGGAGVIVTKAKGAERLVVLRELVLDLVTELGTVAVGGSGYTRHPNTDLVVLEGYSFGTSRQPNQAHALGELGGVIRAALWELGIDVAEIAPASLKKFAVNRGNANKDEVLVAAVRNGFDGHDNNAGDAWWLRQMGLYRFGSLSEDVVGRTAYRDQVVAGIAWPVLEVAS